MTESKRDARPVRRKTVIAVTVGDPAGVGPEIVARLFGGGFKPRTSTALIVGSPMVFRPWKTGKHIAMSAITGAGADERCRAVSGALEAAWKTRGAPRVFWVDTGCRERYSLGKDTRGGGLHAGAALELACRLASQGWIDGLVTAPISKNALALAGYPYTGHTEMLRDVFAAPDCQMMMIYKGFRVVPLTRHIPIARVGRAVTRAAITAALATVDDVLRREFGIANPHIAVAGLNPHAGDGGLVGREEIETIIPAIRQARQRGMRITGPVPGDALFQGAGAEPFDAYLAMYHDQGLIPFKMMSKKRGVNVTVGLPVVRTSVDHGVAYDIAGRGVASTVSLQAAYRLAETLISRRRGAKKD